MSFSVLQELSTLTEPVQYLDLVQVDEAKSADSDFVGIRSVVEDCLADLDDKLGKGGALSVLMKEMGVDKLDSENDKAVLPKLAKTVADFKKEVESLMTEVELMVAMTTEK